MGCLRRLLGAMMMRGRLLSLRRGLGAQKVEVLGRRGEVGDAHVLVRGELEVALQARAGVLGSLSFVAVRQEQYETRGLAPLRLAADDELVDHGLPHVGEVPVLGLPEDERVLRVHGVAVLEAEHRYLRERAVVDGERSISLRQVLQRDVTLVGLGVVEHGVALGESPALRVLPGESYGGAVFEQRGEGQRLRVRPVYAILPAPRGSSGIAARAWS